MTELQRRVAEEYVACHNISLAAKRAGIQGDNARISAWQMLQNEDVQDYIQQLEADISSRVGITAEKVKREIARIAFSDIRDYYTEEGTLKQPGDLSDDAAAALSGIEVDELFGFNPMADQKEKIGETKKIKLYDKLGALEKLMKHLGEYERDNSQLKPTTEVQPVVNVYNTAPPLATDEKEVDA